MSRRPQTARLARLLYAYTALCTLGAVVVFLSVASWHFYTNSPPLRSPPPIAAGTDGAPRRPPPRPPVIPPALVIVVVGGILVVLIAGASYLLVRRITKPLRQLEQAADQFGRGNHAARANINPGDELHGIGAAFDEMAESTEQLLHAKEELLANVAHELRTPLARMRVALDIARESDGAAGPELVESLATDVHELQSLVGDVLSALRVSMTDTLADLEEVNVASFLGEVARAFAAHHPDRKFELKAPNQEVRALLHPELLKRAVTNLLDNARKYSAHAIVLELSDSADLLTLSVHDQGIGISRADLDRVFTPFFRVDRSRNRATGGIGLGLNLVQRIAVAHKGKATLSSEEGQGTTARIEIPKDPSAATSGA